MTNDSKRPLQVYENDGAPYTWLGPLFGELDEQNKAAVFSGIVAAINQLEQLLKDVLSNLVKLGIYLNAGGLALIFSVYNVMNEDQRLFIICPVIFFIIGLSISAYLAVSVSQHVLGELETSFRDITFVFHGKKTPAQANISAFSRRFPIDKVSKKNPRKWMIGAGFWFFIIGALSSFAALMWPIATL